MNSTRNEIPSSRTILREFRFELSSLIVRRITILSNRENIRL